MKNKSLFNIFITMFKIGAFTFGGGYAMISIIQSEFVEKKHWLESDEFYDILAIAESTPGPLAINSATYIGYKLHKILGSIFATVGVVLPSFIIIFLISLFFDKFLSLVYVQYAFEGIKACVAFLILKAGFKMFKDLKNDLINKILFVVFGIVILLFMFFAVNFSSIFYILIAALLGVIFYLISSHKKDVKE